MEQKLSPNVMKHNKLSVNEMVLFIDNNTNYLGQILLIDYMLHFSIQKERDKDKEDQPIKDLPYNKKYFSIPLFTISKIKKNEQTVKIATKDNRKLSFKASEKSVIYDILTNTAFPESKQTYLLFAFEYYSETKSTYKKNGWLLYDAQEEFLRQKTECDVYRITTLNSNFTLCETYPPLLTVPSTVNDEKVREVSKLRSIRRLPVMTYYHKETKCGIWRCSQKKKKFFSLSLEKEYFKAINQYGKGIRIYDARPYFNAVANSFKGGQIEKTEDYDNCEIFFCDIENIHAVKSSLKKCYQIAITNINNKKFFSQLEESLWYEHISCIIKSSSDIANSICDKITVIVHCSDGWDRTTQLCATAEILLDDFYRTIEGFCILIEKDWVSFGHQFSKRNGTDAKDDKSQQSPIFVQWLDVVQQIMHQYPSAFEFRSNLLLYLTDELYTCRFGTFLFNNEKERHFSQAKHKTTSIWSEVLLRKKSFINPYYRREQDLILKPISFIQNLHFWSDYFFKYHANYIRPFNDIIINQEKVLSDMIEILKSHNMISELSSSTQKFIRDKDN